MMVGSDGLASVGPSLPAGRSRRGVSHVGWKYIVLRRFPSMNMKFLYYCAGYIDWSGSICVSRFPSAQFDFCATRYPTRFQYCSLFLTTGDQ